jgi:uncharacterized membrane protein YdjX (TVP38/TMEM64 family)
VIAALAAYSIGRFLGRAVLERIVHESRLRSADRLMAKYGRWAIVLERWIPGVPGDPVSYAAGITRMSPLPFLALTVAGLLPANLVSAYLGSQVAGDVPMTYWLSGVLLVVGVSLLWRGLRRRRPPVVARTGPAIAIDRESSGVPPLSS